jgi:hypothetical protein
MHLRLMVHHIFISSIEMPETLLLTDYFSNTMVYVMWLGITSQECFQVLDFDSHLDIRGYRFHHAVVQPQLLHPTDASSASGLLG